MTPRVLPVLLLLALATGARAQDPVYATATFSASGPAAPGGTVELRAEATITPGWHIYSTTEKNGSPTKLELTLPPGVTAEGALREPAPHPELLEGVGELSLHRGRVTFAQTLRLAPDVKGPLAIPARLVFQTCDDANTQCVMGDAKGTVTLELQAAAAPGPGLPALDLGAAPEARADVALSRAQARPGERVDLVVTITAKAGWHIYATDTQNGAPTTITLRLPPGLARGAAQGPAPEVEELESVGPVRIHRGATRFVVPLEVSAGAPREATLQGKVAWQACDDANTQCLAGEQPFAVTLAVEGGGDAVVRAPEPPAPAPEGPGLWGLFAASIGFGLLTLLLPCTYPMIPITVSIFSKGKTLPRRTALLRAGIYAGGIIISFVLIGAVVQIWRGAAGQGAFNQFATNPWVNLIIGVVFVYFAFSFFGYYEIGMPGFLQRLMQLGGPKREQDGTVPAWSLFLMGFFFVLTSYTCGAPIVLGLFATSAQSPHPGAIIFATTVFATTVALPFFVLSLVPGAVRALPRSGSWFSVFKVALGFMELAFALKFLRGADVIWDIGLLARPVLLVLWTVLGVVTAVYLLGRLPLRFPHDPDLREPSTARGFLAATFLYLSAYFAYGITGAPLLPQIEAFILPEHESATDGEGTSVKFGPLAYRTDFPAYDQALARAKASGRPAFVMFTGHNCVNCALMENRVLPMAEVVTRIEDTGRVALFTDRGEVEARNLQFMQETFGTTVLPSFYLLDGDGKIVARQNGGSDPETFLRFLEAGGLQP